MTAQDSVHSLFCSLVLFPCNFSSFTYFPFLFHFVIVLKKIQGERKDRQEKKTNLNHQGRRRKRVRLEKLHPENIEHLENKGYSQRIKKEKLKIEKEKKRNFFNI